MTLRISLNQQIAELQRELAARRMDPRRFARNAGLRSEREADFCTARLEAARDTLRLIGEHEDYIRAALGPHIWPRR